MKKILCLLLAFGTLTALRAQKAEAQLAKAELEKHLRVLAADAMMGRQTGEAGADSAAAYIARYFAAYGLQPAPGQDDFYQTLRLQTTFTPQTTSLQIGEATLQPEEDFLLLAGGAAQLSAPAVFAGHGWVNEAEGRDDYAGLDVNGKVVFVLPGPGEESGRKEIFDAMPRKQALAAERGAVALFELYRLSFPWNYFVRYFGNSSTRLLDPGEAEAEFGIPYGWLKEKPGGPVAALPDGAAPEVRLASSGSTAELVASHNVIGYLPGSDPALREETLLLSAHYDHVGTGAGGGAATSAADTIFNGARDNAIGAVALLATAKALAQQPPRRSVLFVALTGEEMGMLGSSYYARHPVVPLEKTIFNLNSDGAGYNDTRYVSIVGYDRTGLAGLFDRAAAAFGLEVFPDPAPGQNLFDRSDNVSFARKGVPAITFSPGFTGFDAEIQRNYHQVSDEANDLDYDYLLRFWQAYARTARLIADEKQRPRWKAGDKYEEAGKQLYGW